MKMHTAQHLMSGLAYENFNGTRTVGNQIHATHSRIDFNPISFTEEMLETLAYKANELTKQSIMVNDGIMTREEINSIMPPERTNMNLLPKSVRDLRVVKIGDDVDLCPCAGTHVANLTEIGSVDIIGKKSKGKGTQRITYELSPSNDILEPDSRII
jgi:Ser-tRNA(Ala) deacylase AlaX